MMYETKKSVITGVDPAVGCENARTRISDKATKISSMAADAIMQATTLRSNLIGSTGENGSDTPPIGCLTDELDCITVRLIRLNEILAEINSAL